MNVNNKGFINTKASLVVKPSEDSDVVLDNFYLGEINANDELKYFIEYDKIQSYQGSSDTLFFELVSYKDEMILADNTDTIYIANIQYKPLLPGDINDDGKVNNKDVTRLMQYLANWEVEVNEAVLDTNGDGKVNNKDVTRLMQYLANWDVVLYPVLEATAS